MTQQTGLHPDVQGVCSSRWGRMRVLPFACSDSARARIKLCKRFSQIDTLETAEIANMGASADMLRTPFARTFANEC